MYKQRNFIFYEIWNIFYGKRKRKTIIDEGYTDQSYIVQFKGWKRRKIVVRKSFYIYGANEKITIFVAELEIIHIIYGTQDLFQHIQGIPYSLAYQMLLCQQAGNFAFKWIFRIDMRHPIGFGTPHVFLYR